MGFLFNTVRLDSEESEGECDKTCAKADSFLKVLFHSGEVLLRASRTPLLFPLLNRQVREPQGSSNVSHAPLHCPFITLCAPSNLPQGRQTQAVVTVSCWCCLSSPLNSHFGNAFVQIFSFKTVIKTTTTAKHFKNTAKSNSFFTQLSHTIKLVFLQI